MIINDDDIATDFVIDYCASDIKKYRKRISDIEGVESLSVDEILNMITNDSKDVELLSFFREHIRQLNDDGRHKTAKPFNTVVNSLTDFCGDQLMASRLTSKFLQSYEVYLRRPKTIQRMQGQNMVTKVSQLTDKGLHNHMASLRTLFNQAKKHYNDEDTGHIIIKNAPFSRYTILPKKNKKHKNLDVNALRDLRDYEPATGRELYAKQMFMLSFYMCGMNAVDIFNNWAILKRAPKRISYNRSKTEGKREDGAFISVAIPDEAKEILKDLEIKYKSIDVVNGTLSIGLRSIAKNLGMQELTMLFARHSFATIARNDLNISKEDVAIALNHVNESNRITDTYIAPDWSKIDRVQQAVINKVNEDLAQNNL
ncbi:hypothetical protein GCM10017764_17490 [Sphingobacterium griseoflavum]|uniref:Phage integrase SAM-like domain-containing protein n=2 Tax=Sphingobacterium griseoflavum TaxID=1474952 RepID=A0ABQ3HWI0_9SPHI|nr:hypothetical protein GCM10017764_17490 [Sphingobacterium griseoflavum]